MHRTIKFVLLLLAVALPLHAAGTIFPYAYQEKSLDNGLNIILIPIKNQGLVSYFTIVHAGSRDEIEPGKSGFAHFFEHMMFRGTEKYPAEVYNEIAAEMGADRNAYTTDDYTCYYLHFPSKYLEKVVDLEADRFRNLKYSVPNFQTEAKAVLGEYNKNFANPFFQIEEKLYDTAFEKSSYKHTTMGFLRDIEAMPNQYDYSLTFFERFYRPENCTIVITGNFDPQQALAYIQKYYATWKPGNYKTVVPQEPEQTEAKQAAVEYKGDTLPILAVGYKAPAFGVQSKEFAALDLLGDLAFGETSPLYQQLVLQQQTVDVLEPDYAPHRDPNLFSIYARLKKADDMDKVQAMINSTIEEMKKTPVDAKKLADLKSNLKYGFLMGLDTSKNVGARLARYLELTRNMKGIDELFLTYDSITPEDVRKVAQKYFEPEKKTVVILTGGK